MNTSVCCFTGHRNLPKDKIANIARNLDEAIDALIDKGVTAFISGGALGFDHLAALLVIAKRERGKNIRLIFALPCKEQEALWPEEQKKIYRDLLREADEIRYISEEYDDACMEKRNRYMVEQAAYCICALLRENSGTGQTVPTPGKGACRLSMSPSEVGFGLLWTSGRDALASCPTKKAA